MVAQPDLQALGIGLQVHEIAWGEGGEPGGRQLRRALVAQTEQAWRTLSWATLGGGHSIQRRYVCAEVRNADLPLGVEPDVVAARFIAALGYDAGLVTLTSASVAAFSTAAAREGELWAAVLVTAGLANALRVGEIVQGAPRRYLPDTINMACWVNAPLTFGAHLEALSVVTQARTLEVLEAKVPSLEGNGWASGTGTDCIAVFVPGVDSAGESYAGLHTQTGRVLGRAVREATSKAIEAWKQARQTADS